MTQEIKYFKYLEYTEKRQWKFEEFQIEAFERVVKKLEEAKIELILVQAPITKTLYNCYENNAYFDSLMQSYGKPYYNFNELITLDDSLHFFDYSHLNQSGVEIFDNKLIEILNTLE